MKATLFKIIGVLWYPILHFSTFFSSPLNFHKSTISQNFGIAISSLCIAAAAYRFVAAKHAEAISEFFGGVRKTPVLFEWINSPITGEAYLIMTACAFIISWYPATIIWKQSQSELDTEKILTFIVSMMAISFMFSSLVSLPFLIDHMLAENIDAEAYYFARGSHMVGQITKIAITVLTVINIRRMNTEIDARIFWLGFAVFVVTWCAVLFILARTLNVIIGA